MEDLETQAERHGLSVEDFKAQVALSDEINAELALAEQKLDYINTVLGLAPEDSFQHFKEVFEDALREKFRS